MGRETSIAREKSWGKMHQGRGLDTRETGWLTITLTTLELCLAAIAQSRCPPLNRYENTCPRLAWGMGCRELMVNLEGASDRPQPGRRCIAYKCGVGGCRFYWPRGEEPDRPWLRTATLHSRGGYCSHHHTIILTTFRTTDPRDLCGQQGFGAFPCTSSAPMCRDQIPCGVQRTKKSRRDCRCWSVENFPIAHLSNQQHWWDGGWEGLSSHSEVGTPLATACRTVSGRAS